VMFTHKKADAWDKLGMALIAAGFTVETSWPVNTEFEYSKHQANLASASSTVMLVCRKRADRSDSEPVYLEDIESDIRRTAVTAYSAFRSAGIDGVDLLLSTYGPTLSVVSRAWPVLSSSADADGRARLLRPEEALAIARAEITRVQRARLVGAPVQFDPLTDFTLTFWDTVKAPGTLYDTARRLALAVGQDLDGLSRAGLVRKEGGVIRLLTPKERAAASSREGDGPGVRAQATSFASLIDGLHTVCYVAEEDNLERARVLMNSAGLFTDPRFNSLLQAMVRAVPREVTPQGTFLQPMAHTLDRLCTAYFPDVVLPPTEDDTEAVSHQISIYEELES
jgi:putative DNA methylase